MQLQISVNFDERRLTDAVFLDVAKVFGTVSLKGPVYKLTIPNFPSYVVKTLSSHPITARSTHPLNQPHPHVVA
jgi:hypothetical protein